MFSAEGFKGIGNMFASYALHVVISYSVFELSIPAAGSQWV